MEVTAKIRFMESPAEGKDQVEGIFSFEISNGTTTKTSVIQSTGTPLEIMDPKRMPFREILFGIQDLFMEQLRKSHANFSDNNIERIRWEEHQLRIPKPEELLLEDLLPEEIQFVKDLFQKLSDPAFQEVIQEFKAKVSEMASQPETLKTNLDEAAN